MSNLPESWTSEKLEKLVIKKKGNKPKDLYNEQKENTIPYIDIKAFEKGMIERFADKNKSKLTKKGNILIVWDGARSGLAGKASYEGAIGSTLVDMEPLATETEYLYRFLQTQYDYINSNPRGTGIPHVDPSIFWNIEVPLAPINEQKRIVAKLEKLLAEVDTAQERLEKIPQILKRFRQSVLMQAVTGELTKDWRKQNPDIKNAKELLKKIEQERIQRYEEECKKAKELEKKKPQKPKTRDIIENHNIELELPEKWELVNLGQVIYDFKYGTSNKSEYSWVGLPVIRIPNILSTEVNLDNLKYLKENDVEDNNKVINGDLLIVRSNGSRELVGKNALVANLNKEYAFASYLIRIRPLLIASEYVLLLLNTDLIKEQFFSKAKSSAGINNINTEELSSTMIPLPPIEEQQEIVKRVKALFKTSDRIDERCKKAKSFTDKLTQSILNKAFKGELVPQDPNDEPASALLEKIKIGKGK